MSAIHEAARNGDLSELERLIGNGTPVDAFDENGKTPLMAACESDRADVETVRLLLEKGADVNALTQSEEPPDLGLTEEEWAELPEATRAMMEESRAALKALQGKEPERSSVLSLAARSADVAKIRLLLDHGADPHFKSAAGYTPMISAACAGGMEVVELLIAAGASPDGVTSYGESVISLFSRTGHFREVGRLLELGADPCQLGWTPLHRAVALGTMEEVAGLVDEGADMEETDFWERTAFLLAVHAGDVGKASLLLERGADRAATGRCGKPPVHYPIDRDDAAMLRWLIGRGFDIEAADEFGSKAIFEAVEAGAVPCFETLVDEGADWRGKNPYGEYLISKAEQPDIIRRLIEMGQDPADLDTEILRDWIGLGTGDELRVTKDEFHQGRSQRFGSANPERMDVPFWDAMVRCGWRAYRAADGFGHDSFGTGDPVWCHQRLGMSLTRLPDGRFVQIAGEHEDGYDPDFCIYNDVIVHDGQGGFEIFGYPEEVFPPTDFHSATLVGDWIYIIGNLGYPQTRQAFGYETPVFRLHTGDWHIERVETRGESPGWIHSHRAELENGRIRVSKGKRLTVTKDGETDISDFGEVYRFDPATGMWTEI